jgi:regulator of cell morphogenesis and NO signaling
LTAAIVSGFFEFDMTSKPAVLIQLTWRAKQAWMPYLTRTPPLTTPIRWNPWERRTFQQSRRAEKCLSALTTDRSIAGSLRTRNDWRVGEVRRSVMRREFPLFARRPTMTDLDLLQLNFGATPIGEIAVKLPGAIAIFRKHKLDYCCNGGFSLAAAVERRGADLATIERQLAGLIPQPTETPNDPEAIIDHIVSRYHDTHRRELPELIQLARRVEKVHADHPECPKGLAEFLTEMDQTLGAHMQKEEAILFPMILAGHPMVSAPIAAMQAEHVGHGEVLEALAVLTYDMRPPEGACGSWRALYNGVRKLSDDLTDHIHMENNILFPRFLD